MNAFLESIVNNSVLDSRATKKLIVVEYFIKIKIGQVGTKDARKFLSFPVISVKMAPLRLQETSVHPFFDNDSLTKNNRTVLTRCLLSMGTGNNVTSCRRFRPIATNDADYRVDYRVAVRRIRRRTSVLKFFRVLLASSSSSSIFH